MADKSMKNNYKLFRQNVSTEKLKVKIRQKFRTTLQEARNKNIDSKRFRDSTNRSKRQVLVKYVQNMKEMLMDNQGLRYHISPDEMEELFREIEQEYSTVNNDDTLNSIAVEIESFINSLLHECVVCGKFNESVVCSVCGNQYFSDN